MTTTRWLTAAMLALVAVTSTAAVLGFRSVFADWSFLPAAALGGAGAATIVGLSWWRKLLVGETIALSVAASAIVGAIAARGLPTPDAFRSVVDGLTLGWADVLSRTPPIDVTPELRMLPFGLAWLGTTLGGELLRRSAAPSLPALGPLVALSLSVLVTAEDRALGVAQGAAIGLGALVVGVSQSRLRQRARRLDRTAGMNLDDGTAELRRRRSIGRLVRAGVVVVAIGALAPIVGPRLPLADAHERFDLRDRDDPPWDPLSVASPLVGLKASLKTAVSDDVVFTVESEQPIERWSLAVMGQFDGVVWTVASTDDAEAIAEFRPVGTNLPEQTPQVTAPTEPATVTVTIEALRGPWLPIAGWPQRLDVETLGDRTGDPAGGALEDRLRMNLVTGTVALPIGLAPSLRYELETGIRLAQADETVVGVVEQPVDDDQVELIPPPVRNLAADLLEGIDPGWDQVAAIRDRFVSDGFYDTSPAARPGHSFFRLAEFLDDPDQLIGYEEQYAAAAATIGRLAGLPVRVVVGYMVPEERYDGGRADVRAGDISAWVEVDGGQSGWIPVDVTPDRSREPVVEQTGVTVEDVAIPSPPPPPQIPPNLDVFADEEEPEEDEEDEEEEEEDESDETGRDVVRFAVIAGATAVGSLLLLIPLLIVAWKSTRRRRRRQLPDPADRTSFAWRELLDRFDDAGITVDDRATPREGARVLVAHDDGARHARSELDSMVAVVERAAYHPDPPATEIADRAWHYHDDVVGSLRQHRSPWQRARMAVDPRSLRRHRWGPAHRSHRGTHE